MRRKDTKLGKVAAKDSWTDCLFVMYLVDDREASKIYAISNILLIVLTALYA
jgi:hypothetical protein